MKFFIPVRIVDRSAWSVAARCGGTKPERWLIWLLMQMRRSCKWRPGRSKYGEMIWPTFLEARMQAMTEAHLPTQPLCTGGRGRQLWRWTEINLSLEPLLLNSSTPRLFSVGRSIFCTLWSFGSSRVSPNPAATTRITAFPPLGRPRSDDSEPEWFGAASFELIYT